MHSAVSVAVWVSSSIAQEVRYEQVRADCRTDGRDVRGQRVARPRIAALTHAHAGRLRARVQLRFADCYDALAEAAVADPQDPAPPRAIAGVTWIEILFAQGVTTFEAFTGGVSSGDVARPAAPPMLAARFQRFIDEATALAERQRALADDADANYQIGATAALSALYRATVEGSLLRAFTDGRRAVSAIERARAREPRRRETGLVLGISRYTVSIMSWPVRTLARLGGLSGDREGDSAFSEKRHQRGLKPKRTHCYC